MRHALAVLASLAVAAVLARPAAAVELTPAADRTLSAAQRDAASALTAATLARLPPGWSAALGPLRVDWRDDLPAHVDGRYTRGTLLVRRALLDGWHGDDPNDPGSRAAMAALVHELAHAWDRSASGGMSRDPRLLDLAGWPASAVRTHARLASNDFSDRSPDGYERARPSEFVAVNLEHLLLDADYACRRRALWRYFATRAGIRGTPPDCAAPVFAQPDSDGAADPSSLLEIDPARVYAIDYLLAEPDAHVMSRWGHSMLRLVICAPDRTPGPDCRLDLASHVVLSFRAFVDDVQISSWRGLVGGYPSRLFVLPLPRVVDEYTKVELRGLTSVPLALDRDEIAAVVERAAQVHWSYDGRYRFVTRNCAVETWRLLHDAVPRVAGADIGALSPTGLLRRLERAGLADATVLARPDDARRLGYRFDSLGDHYQRLLDDAHGPLAMPATRVDRWLDLPPPERARWFERADLRTSSALLVLENAALRRAEARAADGLKRRIEQNDELHRELRASLDAAGRLARPAAFAPAGYGIPQSDERVALREALARAAAGWREDESTWRAKAEALLDADTRARVHGARDNVALLGARVRAQAAGAAR